MPVYNISVPPCNTIDALAEQREQRDQRTRARMSKKAYRDAILQRLAEALNDDRHPLGDVVDRLFGAPIRDGFDYRGYLEMQDGRCLGRAILALVCDCSLAEYQDSDGQGF
jgi:hypothetical protein